MYKKKYIRSDQWSGSGSDLYALIRRRIRIHNPDPRLKLIISQPNIAEGRLYEDISALPLTKAENFTFLLNIDTN